MPRHRSSSSTQEVKGSEDDIAPRRSKRLQKNKEELLERSPSPQRKRSRSVSEPDAKKQSKRRSDDSKRSKKEEVKPKSSKKETKPKPSKSPKMTKKEKPINPKAEEQEDGRDEELKVSAKASESSILMDSSRPTADSTTHLSRQLKAVLGSDLSKDGLEIEPLEDNLFVWDVYFNNFDPKSILGQGLKNFTAETGKTGVKLRVEFPSSFPALPPFMRVIYPRFHQYTGHITIGGSVCIHDLTQSGWNPKNDIAHFLVMIRNLLLEGGAMIDMDNATYEYTEYEARHAFERVARQHGWTP